MLRGLLYTITLRAVTNPAKAVRTENLRVADADRFAGVICAPLHRVPPRSGFAPLECAKADDADDVLARVHFGADIQIVHDSIRPRSNHRALFAQRILNRGEGLGFDDRLAQRHVLNQ